MGRFTGVGGGSIISIATGLVLALALASELLLGIDLRQAQLRQGLVQLRRQLVGDATARLVSHRTDKVEQQPRIPAPELDLRSVDQRCGDFSDHLVDASVAQLFEICANLGFGGLCGLGSSRGFGHQQSCQRGMIWAARLQNGASDAGRLAYPGVDIRIEEFAVKTFDTLFSELSSKSQTRPAGSGTVAALDAGIHAIGKKLVEEAAESWMAAEHESADRTAEELSQLLYHAQVLMLAKGLTLEDVYAHL